MVSKPIVCPKCNERTMCRTSKMCWQCHTQKLSDNKKPREYFLKYHSDYHKKKRKEGNPIYSNKRDKCECGKDKLVHSERCLACHKKHRLTNKKTKGQIAERMKGYSKKYRIENKEQIKIKARLYDAKYRKDVSDRYIKGIINTKTGLKWAEIPKDLVEAHRAKILLDREIIKTNQQLMEGVWNG